MTMSQSRNIHISLFYFLMGKKTARKKIAFKRLPLGLLKMFMRIRLKLLPKQRKFPPEYRRPQKDIPDATALPQNIYGSKERLPL